MAFFNILLELLRTEQRIKQVNEKTECGDAGDNVVHDFPLELVAGLGEGPTNEQEQAANSDVKQVEHKSYTLSVTTTWWPKVRSFAARRFSAVGHHAL
jgi:hypothetical protein